MERNSAMVGQQLRTSEACSCAWRCVGQSMLGAIRGLVRDHLRVHRPIDGIWVSSESEERWGGLKNKV